MYVSPQQKQATRRKQGGKVDMLVFAILLLMLGFVWLLSQQQLQALVDETIVDEDTDTHADSRDTSKARAALSGSPSSLRVTFTDLDDSTLPAFARPGEQPVSHVQFLQCLADRLNVDVATRTQRPLLDPESTTPLIVFPMMMELADHRALVCNMTNHIRYVMYVDNGGLEVVGRFLADVGNAFGWTGRVAVRRYPWNAGFSAAVNSAIDWALQLPADVVPFLHVSNNDVRYPPGLYEDRLRRMYNLTRHDGVKIAALAKEVEAESRSPEVLRYYTSGKPLRGNWSVNASLVTSALLPDRVRYMPYLLRQDELENHTSMLFFQNYSGFNTFLLSRLAVLTVGYWDQNFYPAYFEDVDYARRSDMLGFHEDCTQTGQPQAIHFRSVVEKLTLTLDQRMPPRGGRVVAARRKTATVQDEKKRLTAAADELMSDTRRMLHEYRAYTYAAAKWGSRSSFHRPGKGRWAEPYDRAWARGWPTPPNVDEAELRLREKRLARYFKKWDLPPLQSSAPVDPRDESVILLGTHNDHQYLPLDVWVGDANFQARIRMKPEEAMRMQRLGHYKSSFNTQLWYGYLRQPAK